MPVSKRSRRHSERRHARRWEITEQERERVRALQEDGYGLGEVLGIVARSPRVAVEAARAMMRGAIEGAATNGTLVWVLDSQRVRRVVPDAASGATWTREELFSDELLSYTAPDMRVLDLGCGAGRISRHVAPRVKHLTCADASAVLLGEARENLAHLDNVQFVHTDGYTLASLEDAAYDLVYAQGVFSYLDPIAAVALLDEVRRVLRPGGLSVVNLYTIDNPVGAEQALESVRGAARRHRFSGSHPRPYVNAQARGMHELVGLEVVDEVEPATNSYPPTIFVSRPSKSGT